MALSTDDRRNDKSKEAGIAMCGIQGEGSIGGTLFSSAGN